MDPSTLLKAGGKEEALMAQTMSREARESLDPVEWTRFGVLGLGCRVFGSGFEVQGLGLESRVFGLRV